MIKKTLILLMTLFWVTSASAQMLKGRVIDKQTQKNIPFVNIGINDTKQGVVSDVDGCFVIPYSEPIDRLRLSCIGYQTLTYEVSPYADDLILVQLVPKDYALSEVLVYPKENPAHRIIDSLVKYKKRNNYENIEAFSYVCYDKFTAGPNSDIFSDASDTLRVYYDSNIVRKQIYEQDLFISETVYERVHRNPYADEKTILANKASGFKKPSLMYLTATIQRTSIYEDKFKIGELNCVTPLLPKSYDKYFFLIEHTYMDGNDSVFVISFVPKKGTIFDGLKGSMHINANGWAISHVVAEPARKPKYLNTRIQQQYKRINDSIWFLDQMITDLEFFSLQVTPDVKSNPDLDSAGPFYMVARSRSYISNIVLNEDARFIKRSATEIHTADNLNTISDSILLSYRSVPLSDRNIRTYKMGDTLAQKINLDRMAESVESIARKRVSISYVSLMLDKIIRLNDYEGIYLGLGLETNQNLLKWMRVGAYFGYGFRDKAWKYGAHAVFPILREHDFEIGIRYQNDVVEAGGARIHVNAAMPISLNTLRNLEIARKDQIINYESWLNFRILRDLKVELSFSSADHKPNEDYTINGESMLKPHHTTEASVNFRWVHNEKYIYTNQFRFTEKSNAPEVFLSYTRGFKGLLGGQYASNRVDFSVSKSTFIPYFGTFKFRLDAGYIDGIDLIGNMYNGNGTYYAFTFHAPNSFGTMGATEFIADRYVNLFLEHHIGQFNPSGKYFTPGLSIVTNIGFSTLSNPEKYGGIEFKTMEKGYFESGILISNLLNVRPIGLGLGILYRYGPYANSRQLDNFGFKLTLGLAF